MLWKWLKFKVTFEIDVNKVPYIDGALEMAKMGLVPAGTYNNKDYISGNLKVAT